MVGGVHILRQMIGDLLLVLVKERFAGRLHALVNQHLIAHVLVLRFAMHLPQRVALAAIIIFIARSSWSNSKRS